jgi:hypothetical protein
MAFDLTDYDAKTSFEKRMAIVAVGARWLVPSTKLISTNLIGSATLTQKQPLRLAQAKVSSDEAKLESVQGCAPLLIIPNRQRKDRAIRVLPLQAALKEWLLSVDARLPTQNPQCDAAAQAASIQHARSVRMPRREPEQATYFDPGFSQPAEVGGKIRGKLKPIGTSNLRAVLEL